MRYYKIPKLFLEFRDFVSSSSTDAKVSTLKQGNALLAFGDNAAIVLLNLLVALQVADVVATARHLHSMDGCLGAEPGDVTTRGIYAAAALDAFLDEAGILLRIIIERRAAPVCLGHGRLLDHVEYAVVLIDGDDTALLQTLFVIFPETHDARGMLLVGIADELLQAEVEQIVTGNDEHVIIEAELVDGELYVANGSEAGLVGRGAVIHNSHPLRLRSSPVLEVMGELVVGDDDIFIHQTSAVDVVDEPVEDGLVAHFEERLREILGERVEAGSIARCKNEAFH